jgi:hypothetical protein
MSLFVNILSAAVSVDAVEVKQQGITWGSIMISLVTSAGFLTLLGAIIKVIPILKKNALDGNNALRLDMMKHIADLTNRATALEVRLDQQRLMYETQRDYERVAHASELSAMRHRMNNIDQCLTMLLELIEVNPAKAQIAAKKVRDLRAQQESREMAEKATLQAAQLAAASASRNPQPPPGNGTP